MDKLTRRALLRALAGGALATVGTLILARTSLAALGTPEDTNPADVDVQARAAELDLGSAGEAHAQFLNFGDGFRNGGFRNGGFWQRRLPQRRLPQRWLPERRLRQRRLPQRRLPQRWLPERRLPQLLDDDFRRPSRPVGTARYPTHSVLRILTAHTAIFLTD